MGIHMRLTIGLWIPLTKVAVMWELSPVVTSACSRTNSYDLFLPSSYCVALVTADDKAVMAMTTIGLIFFILSFIMVLLYMFIHQMNKNTVLILFVVFAFAAGQLTTKRTNVLPQDTVNSRSREISGLYFSNRPDIWQTPWQQRCKDACQILERYFMTSNFAASRLHESWR